MNKESFFKNSKEDKMKCRICGQYFNMADLREVLYHEKKEHEPMGSEVKQAHETSFNKNSSRRIK